MCPSSLNEFLFCQGQVVKFMTVPLIHDNDAFLLVFFITRYNICLWPNRDRKNIYHGRYDIVE